MRSLRFADVNNGWAFGPDLWVTHDGGANWARSPVPSAGPVQVFDLAAAGGVVHAAVFAAATAPDINIMSAAVAGDDWTVSPTKLPVGAGPVPKVQIELHGSAGWLIQNDRVVVNGARLVGGAWVPWTPPCAGAGGPATLAASTPLNLAAVCVQGIYTGPTVTVAAYLSTDGSTFAPPAHPLPVGSDVQGAASPVPNSLVVADMATLTASFNGAAAWSNVFAGAPNQSWHDLGFTSPTQGVVIAAPPAPAAATLVMTHDGGRTWAPVPFTQG